MKAEEAEIRVQYPTARRWIILKHIPYRTWCQIGVKARKMGIHRTKEAKGESMREGRMLLKNAYLPLQNFLFDRLYPTNTHAELLEAFPGRTLKALQSHARRRHLHRTKEAKARQIHIGREEARRKEERYK